MQSRLSPSACERRGGWMRAAVAAGCVLLAGSAFAQTSVGVEAQASAQADAKVADASAPRDGRDCLRETGTRITALRRAGNRADRDRCVASNGRVYTRDDLDGTGRVDIGDALRALDPSIR